MPLGQRDGELTRERKVPAAAAVSETSKRAARAHQSEEHAGKGCIGTLYRVRGEADLEKTERSREWSEMNAAMQQKRCSTWNLIAQVVSRETIA
jgi:hypothetical protein